MRTITACLLAVVLTACAASGTGDLAPDPSATDAGPVAALVAVVADAGPDVEAPTLTQDASPDVAPTVDGATDAGDSEGGSDAGLPFDGITPRAGCAWFDAGNGCISVDGIGRGGVLTCDGWLDAGDGCVFIPDNPNYGALLVCDGDGN